MYPSQNGMQNGAGYPPQGGMQSGMQGGAGQGQFVSAPIVSSGTGDIVLQPEKKGRKKVIASVLVILLVLIVVFVAGFSILRNDRASKKRQIYTVSVDLLSEYYYVVSLYGDKILGAFSTGLDGVIPVDRYDMENMNSLLNKMGEEIKVLKEAGASINDSDAVSVSDTLDALRVKIVRNVRMINLVHDEIVKPIYDVGLDSSFSCNSVKWDFASLNEFEEDTDFSAIVFSSRICGAFQRAISNGYDEDGLVKDAEDINEEFSGLLEKIELDSDIDKKMKEIIGRYEEV